MPWPRRYGGIARDKKSSDCSRMTVSWSEDDAVAASFLAVVPPEGLAAEIVDLQRRVGIDVDVVPHVTVKAQPGLEHLELWRPAVRSALAEVAPFEISFDGVAWFGDGRAHAAMRALIARSRRDTAPMTATGAQ